MARARGTTRRVALCGDDDDRNGEACGWRRDDVTRRASCRMENFTHVVYSALISTYL